MLTSTDLGIAYCTSLRASLIICSSWANLMNFTESLLNLLFVFQTMLTQGELTEFDKLAGAGSNMENIIHV